MDTNAYVAFKRGHSEPITILQRAPAIRLNSIVLGELLAGFAVGTDEETNHRELQEFLSSPRVTVLPVDASTAKQYALVYRALRHAGTPIPTNDLWIAATAIQHGLHLFSYDQHFRLIDGLHVGASASEFEGP